MLDRVWSLPVIRFLAVPWLLSLAPPAWAADGPELFAIPVDFILFAATLLGVALFHHHVLKVALGGLAVIVLYKIRIVTTGFKTGDLASPALRGGKTVLQQITPLRRRRHRDLAAAASARARSSRPCASFPN